MIKTTIVLSTHNGSRFLEDQLTSLSQQTDDSWTLLVRDDGSSDTSPAILRSFQNCFPKQVQIIDDNFGCLGPAASFSLLLSHITTPYVMLCDQDDVWLSDKIKKTLTAMDAAEEQFGTDIPLLVHSDLRVADQEGRVIAPSFWNYQHLNPHWGMHMNRLLPQNVVTGCTVMINRVLVERALPIPKEAIMHDWWLALVAVLFGQVAYVNEATMLYRQHGKNSIGAKRWGLKRVLRQVQSPRQVRMSMLRSMQQAQVLLGRYRGEMSPKQIGIVEAYACLPLVSKAVRINTALKYRFFQHSAIRTAGFLSHLLTLDRSIL